MEIYNDEDRLKQVLINLVGNSLKCTFAGRIKISIKNVDQDANLLKITVEDTGIGMSFQM
jgi:signal transduction histidine kinase